MASEAVYRRGQHDRWAPHWLKFPLTLFALICPIAFLLVATSKGAISMINLGGSVVFIVEKTLIDLIPPLFVCSLIAGANFIATRSFKARL